MTDIYNYKTIILTVVMKAVKLQIIESVHPLYLSFQLASPPCVVLLLLGPISEMTKENKIISYLTAI